MGSLLSSGSVDKLEIMIEEATRSTDQGVKRFIEPAQGTLSRAVARRPHIVFGRRGSGKSSLLRKAVADLTVDRRPIAFVDLESFKGHSYPDVLISILIQTLRRFSEWLDTAAVNPANKTSFWQKVFGAKPKRNPFDRKQTQALSERLKREIEDLTQVLLQQETIETRTRTLATHADQNTAGGGIALGAGTGNSAHLDAKRTSTTASEQEISESFTRSKLELLHRRIIEYQQIFRDMSALSSGDSYLVLDDLYHIKRSDQARVIDYFHRLGKSANLWIKIGTIRHRSTWYLNGDPPIGMKIGDDADEIDLDLTLERYDQAKAFLLRILRGFFDTAQLAIDEILTDGALDRLVLASGGVARDFLNIFRRSISIARNRKAEPRGSKIGVEDVNEAAGEYDTYKREELNQDTQDDEAAIEREFSNVRDFCLNSANANCFLIEKDARQDLYEKIEVLTDLRLIHKVRSRVTTSSRPGKIYEAYMLDVSQYTASRKKRELEIIAFWRADSTERLRRVALIYPGREQKDC